MKTLRVLFSITITIMALVIVWGSGYEYGQAQRQQTVETRAAILVDSCKVDLQTIKYIGYIVWGDLKE